MPNHCQNYLTVHGPEADIKRFLEATKVVDEETGRVRYAILKNIVPCPQELMDTMAGGYGNDEHGNKKPEQIALEAKQEANIDKYGHKDWYDWCLANWGTKWGDYDTDLTDEEHSVGNGNSTVSFSFDTAWGPAPEGIAKVSGKFPTLRFLCSYEESGMGFMGAFGASKGEIVEDVEGVYPEVPDGTDWDDVDWDEQNERLINERERCEVQVGKFLGIY